eukprot:4577835-Amphidinium_carterae.1
MDVSSAECKLGADTSMFADHAELVFQDIVKQSTSSLGQLFTLKDDQLLTHESWLENRQKRADDNG